MSRGKTTVYHPGIGCPVVACGSRFGAFIKLDFVGSHVSTDETGVDCLVISPAGDSDADTSIGYNVGSFVTGVSRGPWGCVESIVVGVDVSVVALEDTPIHTKNSQRCKKVSCLPDGLFPAPPGAIPLV